MTKMLARSEKNIDKRSQKRTVTAKQESLSEALKVTFPAPTKHLKKLSTNEFFKWIIFCQEKKITSGDALDILYEKAYYDYK